METVSLIITSITSILATLGGLGTLIFWKENKALKKQEVQKANLEIQHAYSKEWKELYFAEKDEEKVLNEKLDDIRRQLNEERKLNAMLTLKVERLEWAKCTVNGCKNRKPPHYYDHDGNEVVPCQGNCENNNQ